ncbi:hypothetical protein QK292_04010 [Arthrobacter sp. AL08]|uniref:hypothetical protein n=1 Tax=unclassified Arthrobacter TaxID=235627 RepID=UPI001CFFB9A7|nr:MULTISPECIES: hypothetical protein [unclassified Arthrobacter]MCB5281550.1 hypothetical protein [Arthrobacter sp. ES1]MDI3240729.1 hypothetical protein [Arthrobacter sp. AL05]MDI3276739.1 hypothetical protein [Arthrobacter sp. AL08]WGZ80426.1 hypothetical protein QI450_04190 [Arthrobacter sp. EM1]
MAGLKAPQALRKAERKSLLRAVKAFHTFAWFTIEACMVSVLYAGVRGRTDRRAGLAAAVLAAETLVFREPLPLPAYRSGQGPGG